MIEKKYIVMFCGMGVSFALGHFLGFGYAMNKVAFCLRTASILRKTGRHVEAEFVENSLRSVVGVEAK